ASRPRAWITGRTAGDLANPGHEVSHPSPGAPRGLPPPDGGAGGAGPPHRAVARGDACGSAACRRAFGRDLPDPAHADPAASTAARRETRCDRPALGRPDLG